MVKDTVRNHCRVTIYRSNHRMRGPCVRRCSGPCTLNWVSAFCSTDKLVTGVVQGKPGVEGFNRKAVRDGHVRQPSSRAVGGEDGGFGGVERGRCHACRRCRRGCRRRSRLGRGFAPSSAGAGGTDNCQRHGYGEPPPTLTHAVRDSDTSRHFAISCSYAAKNAETTFITSADTSSTSRDPSMTRHVSEHDAASSRNPPATRW